MAKKAEITKQIDGLKASNKTNIAKISASYNRKVALKAISSQYDNITQGVFVTCYITFDNQEEFDKKVATISKRARELTELEIGKSISELMKMAENPDNEAVLGIGTGIDHKKYLESELGDLSDLISEKDRANEVIAKIADFEEVDIDAIEA